MPFVTPFMFGGAPSNLHRTYLYVPPSSTSMTGMGDVVTGVPESACTSSSDALATFPPSDATVPTAVSIPACFYSSVDMVKLSLVAMALEVVPADPAVDVLNKNRKLRTSQAKADCWSKN